MIKTFDMQFIRYINLFGRVTKVNPKHCFSYNNMLVFIVPYSKVEQAIGKNNINLKKISEILGKRIRVIPEPKNKKDIKKFITILVYPIQFNGLEVTENQSGDEELLITADLQGRSMLIGRNKIRLEELKNIVEQYFGIKNVRIA